MSEHDRPRRARSHPLGVPTEFVDEETGARRTRLATLQAFQAVAQPIVIRVDGLERKVDDLVTAQHEADLAAVESRAATQAKLDQLLARQAADAEQERTSQSRRWDLVKLVLAPMLTFAIGVAAARFL